MKSYGEEQKVITAYLDGHINLGRAAVLLGLSSYELDERFRRLEVPRRIGPDTTEEARAEVRALSLILLGSAARYILEQVPRLAV